MISYHPALLERYPNVVGGFIIAQGMTNQPTPTSLQSAYAAEQEAVIARIGDTALSEIPALAAWRRAFAEFGVKPTQYRSAAEALLRRLTKKGDIPSINTLVDIGNLVSIRYALPVAVFDMRQVAGAITIHFADGAERYTGLGETEVEHPEVGEVVFSDESALVLARRWCWRQSAESAAQLDTTDAIISIEAHHDNGRADVEAGLADLQALLKEYAGGTFEVFVQTA